MRRYYIGDFPPPLGGVTIKNENLFAALSERLDIKKIDFKKIKRGNIREMFRLIRALLDKDASFAVGIAGRSNRKLLTKLLYKHNRKGMERSVLFLMGGSAADDISDEEYRQNIQEYRKVYAETAGMVRKLEEAGLTNAGCCPNGRFKPQKVYKPNNPSKEPLRCVFFSIIRPEKGVDIILRAAKHLPNISFDFYGPIDEDYKDKFLTELATLNNAKYFGVFNGKPEEIYDRLNEYNVVLLPTYWKAEGVPGVLVEAKIACVPAVVSDYRFNAEIIHDGEDGLVLSENSPVCLENALRWLEDDREFLYKMSLNAQKDAEKYYIENFVDEIVSILE